MCGSLSPRCLFPRSWRIALPQPQDLRQHLKRRWNHQSHPLSSSNPLAFFKSLPLRFVPSSSSLLPLYTSLQLWLWICICVSPFSISIVPPAILHKSSSESEVALSQTSLVQYHANAKCDTKKITKNNLGCPFWDKSWRLDCWSTLGAGT